MLPTTFDFGGSIGERSVFLLNDPPDWRQPLKSTFTILQSGAVGLSNRETRRPHSATLRCSLEYQATRSGPDAGRLIGALRDLADATGEVPVLCPFWPAAVRWIDPIPASALYVVWKEDWSQWEIYSGTGVPPVWPETLPGECMVAPLLWGRLAKRELNWASANTLTCDVEFIEDGPAAYALVPPAAEFAAGPMPLAGYTTAPRLLPYRANFVGIEDSVSINLLRESIGFGRQPAQTFYPQAARRSFKLPYFLDGQTAAFQFLRFFLEYVSASFWTPGWMSAAQLLADVAAADTVLQVADTHSLLVGDYIALLDSSANVSSAIVSALTDDTVTLLAPIGADYKAADTIITPLLLVRLGGPIGQVQINWENPHAAIATLQLIELPAEYAPASGETIGETLGQLTQRCYLYEFTRDLGGETITDRYTSYEADVTLGDDTYAAAKIEHGDIQQGIALEQDAVQVTAFMAPLSALLLFATLKMEAPLKLTIRQADVAAGVGSDPAVLFVGEIASVKVQGSKMTAKAVTAGTVFDRKIPRFYLQVPCNHALFSPGCGLDKDDWRFTAQLLTAPLATYPFALSLHSLAGPAVDFAEHWFSGGWVEFGVGAALQRRAILNSTTVTVGALTVWLNRPFDPLPAADDEVALWPGCDLRAETCQSKFDNYLNFGGHPFLPAANPSLVKLSQPVAGGKK